MIGSVVFNAASREAEARSRECERCTHERVRHDMQSARVLRVESQASPAKC
jgi:hypothetical protein